MDFFIVSLEPIIHTWNKIDLYFGIAYVTLTTPASSDQAIKKFVRLHIKLANRARSMKNNEARKRLFSAHPRAFLNPVAFCWSAYARKIYFTCHENTDSFDYFDGTLVMDYRIKCASMGNWSSPWQDRPYLLLWPPHRRRWWGLM